MQNIVRILNRIITLLKENEVYSWADLFEKFYIRAINNDKEVVEDIIKVYGGMGSFSDIVLSVDNKPLIEENDELNELREKLFEECMEVIVLLRKSK